MDYQYSAQPHAAPIGPGGDKRRNQKFREQDASSSSNGIAGLMADPRVIRGSTYSTKPTNKGTQAQSSGNTQQLSSEPGRTKKGTRRKWVESRVPTPPPVEGRENLHIQTDEYVEVLYSRPEERAAESQTLAIMDRPSTPLFRRVKEGQDTDTQIMPGDIFAFDIEVVPVLEVLVSKTLHCAMLELMQEEELEAMTRQWSEHELLRDTELAETQRLEAEARRVDEERGRRAKQSERAKRERIATQERIVARKLAAQYLEEMHEAVFRYVPSSSFELVDLFHLFTITPHRWLQQGLFAFIC